MTAPVPPEPAAWLPRVREELLGPAHALRELGAMLLEDAAPHGPPGLIGDLQTVQAVATHLEDLLHELLDRLAELPADAPALVRLRHDVRTPLNQIIGYCDLWLEGGEEDAAAAECFRRQLERLRSAGLSLLTHLDALKADAAAAPAAGAEGPGAVPVPAVPEVALAPSPEPGRLLVVDDNAFNREVLARRLQRQGHTVVEAVHGRHALELLAREHFDVVLLDILMPEMDGVEVLQRLKADDRLRHLPVIMISALSDIDHVAHCIQTGADDYLPRPYNAVVLKARVDALLERKRLRDREVEHLRQIEREKERVNELLHVILPAEAVRELREHGEVRPRRYENVAVLFADVVGFTPYCDAHPAEEVVAHLRRLVGRFEGEAEACGVQKVKTVGDAFMAAAGLLRPSSCPSLDCVRLGAAMVRAAPQEPPHWQVRVGIHVGPVMAGVVGSRQYLYDLWGDTVNTAARVQSHGAAGAVTLTREAWECVAGQCRGRSLGEVVVKGKGAMELIELDGFVGEPGGFL
jgi:class 3 adenylate cyclase/CheY-like chemotaxis protein